MRRSNASFATLVCSLLVAVVAASCGSQQQLGSDVSFTPSDDSSERRDPAEMDDEALKALPPQGDDLASSLPLLGVRPDLALSTAAPQTARCVCLSVEVGPPGDSKFQWQAGVPQVGAGALAIAISSRGVECPGGEADDTKRRPSISAVDIDGNDVVIEVEELPDGPPLAAGALIPEPGPGGSVYVRGRGKKTPYARSKESSRCKVR